MGTYQFLDRVAQTPVGAFKLASRTALQQVSIYALLQLLQVCRLTAVTFCNRALRFSLASARGLGGLSLGLAAAAAGLPSGSGGCHDGMWETSDSF